MVQNEYKYAYVWPNGFWDSLWYFHKQDMQHSYDTLIV